MFSEKEEVIDTDIIFPAAEFKNNKLIFENDKQYKLALQEGVFFVKIPDYINVEAGITYVQNFYKQKDGINDEYKGFNTLAYEESILGYSDRPDQVEQVQLELTLWNKYFPQALTTLLMQMNDLGLNIIQEIFHYLQIPEKYWNSITGNAAEGKGLQYCIFNHYRTERETIGINTHKDSGFITVLYSPEPGLEAFTQGKWVPINPKTGYFTINLGHSFEVLTEKLSVPITAVEHCVKQVKRSKGESDRYSFGTYIGPRFDMDLYQLSSTGELDFYQRFIDFQKIKAKKMGYEFHPKVKIV